ncbi:MAG: SusE domain-containing protein [Bacteroidales bacterium]|nr:SusE domain-containing protein [Bacteroidales bacterium]
MKKIITLILMVAVLLYSCEKEVGPALELVTAPVLMGLDSTNFVLSDDVSADTIITFKWSKAEYNLATEIYYTVEIAEAGTNFSNPVVIISDTYADSASITAFTLNKFMAVNLGLGVGSVGMVEFRVNSYVGKSDPGVSNSVEVTATTYDPPYTPVTVSLMNGDVELKSISLLDEFVGNTSLNVTEYGMYEGYVWLTEGNLSITIKGGEDLILGREPRVYFSESSASVGAVTTHILAQDATNPITVDTAGYYRFKLNMNTLVLEVMPTCWGVIGSGIPPYDWSTSVVMVYSVEDDLWTTQVETHSAEFKFRPNQTWDPLNYGDDGNNGTLNEYGSNIPVDAGTKIITLNLNQFPYEYSVQNAKK